MIDRLSLHNFATSSASQRVRIALYLKGLPFEYVPVNIQRQGTDAFAEYKSKNPQGLVPTLFHGDVRISQSLAILEYLEEIAPAKPLLPSDPGAKARVRSLAMFIVSEIQPLQNLRVFKYLLKEYQKTEDEGMAWRRHWVSIGLDALEKELSSAETGLFCHGNSPTLADCCLVPQVHSSKRWGLDIKRWPTIARIAERCDELEAFQKAAPERQVDFA